MNQTMRRTATVHATTWRDSSEVDVPFCQLETKVAPVVAYVRVALMVAYVQAVPMVAYVWAAI